MPRRSGIGDHDVEMTKRVDCGLYHGERTVFRGDVRPAHETAPAMAFTVAVASASSMSLITTDSASRAASCWHRPAQTHSRRAGDEGNPTVKAQFVQRLKSFCDSGVVNAV